MKLPKEDRARVAWDTWHKLTHDLAAAAGVPPATAALAASDAHSLACAAPPRVTRLPRFRAASKIPCICCHRVWFRWLITSPLRLRPARPAGR